mmetsp:Transcript_33557/g.79416  ORF Transcript_33557/g.79416 Transcript_33557/m.79416 type:complete len:247 (-) Transcript_33557:497-1237(-)
MSASSRATPPASPFHAGGFPGPSAEAETPLPPASGAAVSRSDLPWAKHLPPWMITLFSVGPPAPRRSTPAWPGSPHEGVSSREKMSARAALSPPGGGLRRWRQTRAGTGTLSRRLSVRAFGGGPVLRRRRGMRSQTARRGRRLGFGRGAARSRIARRGESSGGFPSRASSGPGPTAPPRTGRAGAERRRRTPSCGCSASAPRGTSIRRRRSRTRALRPSPRTPGPSPHASAPPSRARGCPRRWSCT